MSGAEQARLEAWQRANPEQAVRCHLPSSTFFLFCQNCEPLSASSWPLFTLHYQIRELDKTWQWLYLSSATILENDYHCSSSLFVYLHSPLSSLSFYYLLRPLSFLSGGWGQKVMGRCQKRPRRRHQDMHRQRCRRRWAQGWGKRSCSCNFLLLITFLPSHLPTIKGRASFVELTTAHFSVVSALKMNFFLNFWPLWESPSWSAKCKKKMFFFFCLKPSFSWKNRESQQRSWRCARVFWRIEKNGKNVVSVGSALSSFVVWIMSDANSETCLEITTVMFRL